MTGPADNPNRRRFFSFRKRKQQIEISDSVAEDVESEQPVHILPGAVLEGNVVAPEIIVSGLLRGTAVAHEVTVGEEGQLWGDVFTANLQVTPGGKVRGWINSLAPDAELALPDPDPEDQENGRSPTESGRWNTLQQLQTEAAKAQAARLTLEKQFESRLQEEAGSAFETAERLAEELTTSQAETAAKQKALDTLQAKLEQKEEQITTQAEQLAQAADQLGQQTKEMDAMHQENEALFQELTDLRTAKNETDATLLQTQNDLSNIEQRAENLEGALQNSIRHASEQEEALVHWQELAEVRQKELTQLEKERDTLQRQLNESVAMTGMLREKQKQLEVELQRAFFDLEELQQQKPDATTEELQYALADAHQQIAALKSAVSERDEVISWHKVNLKTMQMTLEQSRQINGRQQALLTQLRQELATKETAVKKWKTAVENMADRFQEQNDKIAALQADLENTRSEKGMVTEQQEEVLRNSNLQIEAYEMEIDRYSQETQAQGERLAEIQSALVEHELELKQARATVEKQAKFITRMKQVTEQHVHQLEQQLAQAHDKIRRLSTPQA